MGAIRGHAKGHQRCSCSCNTQFLLKTSRSRLHLGGGQERESKHGLSFCCVFSYEQCSTTRPWSWLETCEGFFFSAHGTVGQWLLPSNKGWGGGRACSEVVWQGLVDVKCRTAVPCCLPGSGEVDCKTYGSQDEAVALVKGW